MKNEEKKETETNEEGPDRKVKIPHPRGPHSGPKGPTR